MSASRTRIPKTFIWSVLTPVVALGLAACATHEPAKTGSMVVAPAPVSYDGNVAGRATDAVFVLVPDGNPTTPGLAMRSGDAIRVVLPTAFKRNDEVAITADEDVNMVATKGWPQGAVKLADQYQIGFDERSHALFAKALTDVPASGANAPGIKILHLRGRTFMNPASGSYPVRVEQVNRQGTLQRAWTGTFKVLQDAPPARLAPSNFHLPPGTNADYQKVAIDQTLPHPMGLLLWGPGGSALNSVGVAPRDLGRYPRFTGGLLVQDTNGDKLLDPSVDNVVGGIIGEAPQGAKGQAATSPNGVDGKPVLSGEALRNPAFPADKGGGKPNPGLLLVSFRSGDTLGLYRPTFELLNGNAVTFTQEAVAQ